MNPFYKRLILLSVSILPLILNAQSKDTNKFNFGIGAGVSINDAFNHVMDAKFKSRLSPILITINAQKQLENKWGILAELDYIHKGPIEHDISYLTFSFLAQHKISTKPTISILAGPYIGYLFKYESYGVVFKHKDLKNHDIGIDTGLNFSMRLSEKISLFISPRLEVGMMRFSFSNNISYQLKTGITF